LETQPKSQRRKSLRDREASANSRDHLQETSQGQGGRLADVEATGATM
jgi:hypothetical protein